MTRGVGGAEDRRAKPGRGKANWRHAREHWRCDCECDEQNRRNGCRTKSSACATEKQQTKELNDRTLDICNDDSPDFVW